MYDPKGNGKTRAVGGVRFTETEPPAHLHGLVHRFVELKTEAPLSADYRFHALPDACTYLVFDQTDPAVTGAAQLRVTSEEFNLGRSFHFVNIRFFPGVWQSAAEPVKPGLVDAPYTGAQPFEALNRSLIGTPFPAQQDLLIHCAETLLAQGIIAPNPITTAIFAALDDLHSVADMAEAAGLSARQLQRRLKASTGFAPHDFLKVLRLQQALDGEATWSYADQSHFIHSFRNATGYTPGRYGKKFDV